MRLRPVATTVMVLAMALVGCSDDPESETESVSTTSTSVDDGEGDAELQALQDLLTEQGIDASLATFGVDWCTHQDLAMLSRDVGNMELAEQVSAAASETAC